MYDDARYSLTRYSLSQEGKNLPVEDRFSEAMGAVAGGAVPVALRGRFSEAMQGTAMGTISVPFAFTAYEELDAAMRMSADVVLHAALSGALWGEAHGSKNLSAALSTLDELESAIWSAKNIPACPELSDSLTGEAWAAKDLSASLSASEVLAALLSATSQTTERAVFQLTVPPGGELRIDSELFTVLLDGESALHLQNGDWINVSRDLLRLTVETASGRLEGQLIYTERYL